jgi:hypothetical protein
MAKLNCFHCDWSGSKYELLIGQNGVKCPKCEKHIPQDAEGWISVENGLPETGGMYDVKTTIYGVSKVPFTKNGRGEWGWLLLNSDKSIITHWRY